MGKSKTETKQQQTITPTLPGFAVRDITDQSKRINELAQRDPREFVAPASPLQNAAFGLAGGLANRMSGGTMDFASLLGPPPSTTQPNGSPAPVDPNPSQSSPGTVRGWTPPQAGSASNYNGPAMSFMGAPASWTAPASNAAQSGPFTASPTGAMQSRAMGGQVNVSQIGQPDFNQYVTSQPDLAAEFSRVSSGGFGPNLPKSYDANGNGQVDQAEYGKFHFDKFGQNEQRIPPTVGGVSPAAQSNAAPMQARDPVTGAAIGQVGAVELGSPNPNDMFTGAGLLAGQVGTAGANLVDNVALSQAANLGPANGYNAAGAADIERAQSAGMANVLGYDPAQQAAIERAQASGAASAQGYNPVQRAAIERANASGPAGVTNAAAALAQAQGMAGVRNAGVQGATAQGAAGVTNAATDRAQASLLGDAQGYDAATVDAVSAGFAPTVELGGYDPTTGQASLIGDLPQMQAAQIAQGDIDRFMNPYLDEVVGATEADLNEQFGRQDAALAAAAAGAGAFGGSRFGIREAQQAGEQSRALGSTLGGLRADGFNTALQFADRDAGRRQDANASNFSLAGERAFANADAGNRFGLANMDAENQAAAFTADAQNRGLLANQDMEGRFALTDAEAQNRANLTNAGLLSDAARFGADAANEFERANQQAQNQIGLANADAQNRANLANADARNRSALDLVNRRDTVSLSNADAQNRANLTNADAFNRASLDFAGRRDAVSLSNADSQSRANLANADARNRSALDFAGRRDDMSRTNADAFNRAELDRAARRDEAGRFGADAQNRSALDLAQRRDAMARTNADAFNRSALDAAARGDEASRFGADAFNRSSMDEVARRDAMARTNADAFNRASLDEVGRRDNASQFGADAQNRFDLSAFDANTQANFRNADAINLNNRFNADQSDEMLARRLQAAGLLGDLGATVGSEDRANLSLLSDLGNQQREIDRAFRNADPTMVELLGQLRAMQDLGLLRGQTSQGTSTTTERGSPLDQIGQVVGIASALGGMSMGGGGGMKFG
jgi:hypothetical protein